MERMILHADLNNFFASVECLEHKELRDKPLAVAGDAQARHGIVLAKNEPAKRCGVTTGTPLWKARQLCPDLICVPPRYDVYMQFSAQTREICQRYTSQVESFGLDECWMDVTGSTALFGNGKTIADTLRKQIYRELGLTVSVGVSFNKVFAKLGSDLKKPDATTVISRDCFREILWPLPAEMLLFVGRATRDRIRQFGLSTIGDLAAADPNFLRLTLGKSGLTLWRFANGLDDEPVLEAASAPPLKSIGNSTTSYRDLISDADRQAVLYALAETVSHRLRKHRFLCSTVQLSVRRSDLSVYERQRRLEQATYSTRTIFDAAWTLLKQHHDCSPIRSLGIRGCQLSEENHRQISLFDADDQRTKTLEDTLEEIKNRFGEHAVRRAIQLTDPRLTDFKPKDHSIFA